MLHHPLGPLGGTQSHHLLKIMRESSCNCHFGRNNPFFPQTHSPTRVCVHHFALKRILHAFLYVCLNNKPKWFWIQLWSLKKESAQNCIFFVVAQRQNSCVHSKSDAFHAFKGLISNSDKSIWCPIEQNSYSKSQICVLESRAVPLHHKFVVHT